MGRRHPWALTVGPDLRFEKLLLPDPAPPATDTPAIRTGVLANLPNATSACAVGRQFVAAQLTGLSLPSRTCDAVVLLASELIANAVLHAPPPVCLQLLAYADRVRIEVHDSTRAPPRLHRPPPDATGGHLGGRGVWLIDQLATRWGHHDEGPGKAVWFEVQLEVAQGY